MAKAELGILLQNLRGKAGNSVFQGSRDGIVVRPRVQGTNPNTPAQQAVRAAFTLASQTYRGYTTEQVGAWELYATTQTKRNKVNGKSYSPTGIAVYIELSTKFLLATPGGTLPSTPPTTPFAGDSITVTATAGVGKVTFTATAANATGVTTELLLQPLKSANRKPQHNGYRSKAYFAFVSGTLTHDVPVPVGYYAAAYRFVKLATGQATPLFPLTTEGVTFAVEAGSKKSKAA
jgi:hypothetical protein